MKGSPVRVRASALHNSPLTRALFVKSTTRRDRFYKSGSRRGIVQSSPRGEWSRHGPNWRTSVGRSTEADSRASAPVCRRRSGSRRIHRSGWLVQAEPGRRVRPPTPRPRSPRQLDRRFLRRLWARRMDEAARESIRAFAGRCRPGARSLTAGRGRLRDASRDRRGAPVAASRGSLPPCLSCLSELDGSSAGSIASSSSAGTPSYLVSIWCGCCAR